jgi:autotransporter-associated beta strand protein
MRSPNGNPPQNRVKGSNPLRLGTAGNKMKKIAKMDALPSRFLRRLPHPRAPRSRSAFASVLAALLLAAISANTAGGQTFLVDFGMNTVTQNGTAGTNSLTTNATSNGPDARNNYWNNMNVNGTATASVPAGTSRLLVTTANVTSSITMNLTTSDAVAINGGDNLNLSTVPLASISNQNLAVQTAVVDAWYVNHGTTNTGVFTLTGLNQYETYDFSILSTRPVAGSDARAAIFTANGTNTGSVTISSAKGTTWVNNGSGNVTGNLTAGSINGITPNGSQAITLSIGWNSTGSAVLNALQLTGYVPYKDGGTHSLSSVMSYPGNTILSNATTVTGTVAGVLGNGTSALEVGTGGGTLNLGGNETVTSLIGSGNLALTTGASILTINTGGTTTFSVLAGTNGANVANEYSGILSGSGTINKAGSGTQILSGTNTYSGSITINSGRLQFSGTGNANSSTILLGDTSGSSNATLDLNGVNQTYGSAIAVQAGSTGVLTINSLNASGTNTLSNTITLNKAATLSAAGGGTLSVNTITGVSAANTLTISGPGTVNLGGSADNTNLSIAAASGTLILAKSNSGPGGSGAGVRSLGGTLTITGATVQLGGTGQGGSTTSVDQIYDNASVVLNSGTFDLNGRSETIGGFSGTGGTVTSSAAGNATLTVGGSGTFSGVIQNGSGTVSFTKTGDNTTTFNGSTANTYTGTTTVSGGTSSFLDLGKTTGNAISGNITVGVGAVAGAVRLQASDQIADTSIISLDGNATNQRGVLRLNGFNETIGGLSSVITGGGVVDNFNNTNSTLTLNVASGTQTYSGQIRNTGGNSTGTLALIKTGAGTQILSSQSPVGNNSYAGGTQINGGTLQVAGTSALGNGNVTFGGGTLQYASGGTGTDYSGRIKSSGSVISLDTNGQSVTMSGIIDSSNTAGLTKLGSGTLILSGTNTYSGTTTISAGTLQIGNGGTSGALSANSTITNNGILVFNRSDTVTAGTDFSGSPISGSGSIVQNGSGKLLLWSGNTFTGGVTINSGTLGIWEGSSLGAIPGSPTTQLTFGGNSTLQFEQTPTALPLNANRRIAINPGVTATIDTQSYRPSIAGVISGATGALVKMGSGNLTLSGNNTYGGGTSVTAGTLTLGHAKALGSTTAALSVSGATLNMNTYGATVGALTSSNGTFSGFNLGGSGNTLAASSATLSGTTYIGIIGSSITGTGTSNVITSSGGGLTSTVQFAGAQDLSVPVNSIIVKNGNGTFYRATLNSTDTAAQVIITGSVPSKVLSVMPLGASIMAGTSAQSPYDGGGFHTEMYQNLVNDGRFTPDFVGSSTNLQTNNPTSPNLLTSAGQTNNEGHPGYTTSQILNNLNANDGSGGNNGGYWLAPGNGVNPNYIPLNVGGNDFAQNHTDAQAINRYDAIISQLNTLRAGVDTLATNLMYRSDVGSYINTYFNPYVQGVVYNHVLAGQNVQFVDLYGLLTPNNSTYPDNPYISSDRVHPNQAGYNRMGDILYSSTVYGAAYWTGSQGGNWNTLNGTSTNWAMDSALTTDRQALLTDATANTYSNADVFFNGNASPLATTLGADTTVRSLNFAAGATGAVTVGGNNMLTIGSGGITMQQGTGAHTVSSNIALASDQTWGNVSSNNLTVSGSVSGSGNLTIVGSYTVYSGNSSSSITPTTVTGTGAFVLSGNNTYTGATSVTGGTLVVNGGLASPSVTVGAAGTLGGTGTIAGDTTIAGTHTPGNSPGIQTFAGNLTYSGGLSAVNWELAANSTTNAANPNAIFDTVVVAGNLSFNGVTDLNLSFKPVGGNVIWSDPFWQTSKSGTGGWLVYDVTGAITNFENLSRVTTNWLDSGDSPFNSVLGGSYFSLYQSVSGKQIYLNYTFSTVTTPEPSSAVAMAVVAILGGAVFLVRRNGRA